MAEILIIALAAVALGGCVVEDGRPPLARIELVPEAIPENDGFQTAVTLDGTTSADPIDDPDGAAPLDHHWEIIGDEAEFEPGDDADDAAPQVRFRGDRPATIRLTVTDRSGLDATATVQLQLTVR